MLGHGTGEFSLYNSFPMWTNRTFLILVTPEKYLVIFIDFPGICLRYLQSITIGPCWVLSSMRMISLTPLEQLRFTVALQTMVSVQLKLHSKA